MGGIKVLRGEDALKIYSFNTDLRGTSSAPAAEYSRCVRRGGRIL
jgi:hypothetical protein